MGQVEALCISEKKGVQKRPVDSAVFLREKGIQGDAHAGDWHRQVSILGAGDIEATKKQGLSDLKPGDFAENVVLAEMDLIGVGLGSRIRLGADVVLAISQIGKVCHTPCRIGQLTGDCIMPRLGLFARVEKGGQVKLGDKAEVIEQVDREVFQAAVVTISDRCSRGEAVDTAGPAVGKCLEEGLGCHIYRTNIVPDEKLTIAKLLKHYCKGHSIDLVVTVGGTGFSPRDITPEATREVLERATPGLDEAMRAGSLAKTAHAMLSRGVSGIRGSTLIVNLPGSERAATENIEVILPALKHGLLKLRGDMSDCAPPSA